VNRNEKRRLSWNNPNRVLARFGISIIFLFLVLPARPADQPAQEMVVQTKDCVIRSGPSFLSEPAGSLKYGDGITVVEESGPWRKIALPGNKLSGWIHVTALSPPKAEFKAGTSQASSRISSGEVALAGRGFDAEVEARLRQSNKDLNYQAVDKIEAAGVKQADVITFVNRGKLLPKESR
jgi:uncharacterized protein YgiM (DUF1202 family)